jgi:hypothetical protein
MTGIQSTSCVGEDFRVFLFELHVVTCVRLRTTTNDREATADFAG